MFRQWVCAIAAVAAATFAGIRTADAGLTEVRAAAGGEASHEQILERIYGGDITAGGADLVGADGLLSGGADGVAPVSQRGRGYDIGGGLTAPAGGDELVIAHARRRQYRAGDSADQLVTHAVSGDGADDTLLSWEDWSVRERSDMDFNDLVLRSSRATAGSDVSTGAGVSGAKNAAAASIPLPPAVLPGAAGIVGVALVAVRRYRRR